MTLRILPPAEEDIELAYSWYESQVEGLGKRFLETLGNSLKSIEEFPESFAVVKAPYRRALVRKFPYSVFFEQTVEQILVWAVFHNSRNPDKWEGRLP